MPTPTPQDARRDDLGRQFSDLVIRYEQMNGILVSLVEKVDDLKVSIEKQQTDARATFVPGVVFDLRLQSLNTDVRSVETSLRSEMRIFEDKLNTLRGSIADQQAAVVSQGERTMNRIGTFIAVASLAFLILQFLITHTVLR